MQSVAIHFGIKSLLVKQRLRINSSLKYIY